MNGMRKLLIVFAVFALVAAACAQEEAEGPEGEVSLELRIGHVVPLTGALSDFGPPIARAAQLGKQVFEEAAAAAGVDISITITEEDSQTDPQAGVEAARKLVETNNVQVVLGGSASSVTIAVAESVTIPNGIVQISCCSTSGDITGLEDNGFVNRTPPSDEHQAPILADVMLDAFGEGATINVGARQDAYGNFIIDQSEKELTDRGLNIGTKTFWDPQAATYDSEAQRIVQGDPDGWLLVDFPATWQKVSSALVRTGNWDPARTFSADGLKTPFLPEAPPTGSGKQATEGMRGTAPAGTGAFDDLWQERVGEELGRGAFDAHGFDGLILAALAAVAGQSSDPADIRDNLRAVSGPPGTKYRFEDLEEAIADLVAGEDIDYEGASGPINLDENGDPQSVGARYDLWQIKDGRMTSLEVFVVEA